MREDGENQLKISTQTDLLIDTTFSQTHLAGQCLKVIDPSENSRGIIFFLAVGKGGID